MSQYLVDYILSLPGGVDEFIERANNFDIPSELWQNVIDARKQGRPRTVVPSSFTLYRLIEEVYPDRQANKEAYARQELAKGKSVTEVANAMRLDRKTLQRWKKKWKAAEDEAASA